MSGHTYLQDAAGAALGDAGLHEGGGACLLRGDTWGTGDAIRKGTGWTNNL